MKQLRKGWAWLRERVTRLGGDTRTKEVRDAPFGCLEMTFSGERHKREAEELRKAGVANLADYRQNRLAAQTPAIFAELVEAGLFHRRAMLNGVAGSCGLIAMRDTQELFIYVYPIVSAKPTVVISPTSMEFCDIDWSGMSDADLHCVLNKLLIHLKKQNLNDKENVNG